MSDLHLQNILWPLHIKHKKVIEPQATKIMHRYREKKYVNYKGSAFIFTVIHLFHFHLKHFWAICAARTSSFCSIVQFNSNYLSLQVTKKKFQDMEMHHKCIKITTRQDKTSGLRQSQSAKY